MDSDADFMGYTHHNLLDGLQPFWIDNVTLLASSLGAILAMGLRSCGLFAQGTTSLSHLAVFVHA
ncbi:hypothetical protein C1752_05050 [Acaryochloris thomasi RCC1774]|uniref:Uncharacterized protein n=1 Tax=Acaryochloris thomasi RCC1774 TaxID=1764569 RepID=A0A2W1JLC6_9CYAN|nr:hypothetical protein [Acaryochloris thomasi]PZD71712.1 hypothetical protein C1752_05050 [Acaryochloris thomasi RCC1774]